MFPMVRNRWARWLRGPLPTWHHPDYRLPLPSLEARTGAEPRRADFVAWFLVTSGALRRRDLRSPNLIGWDDLARVHSHTLLQSLDDPQFLARVYGTDAPEVPVDEMLRTVRLACGGTLAAARAALEQKRPTLNLLGGFHHAGPDRAGGACPVNDIAVAIAALRAEGFDGRVLVIDLDAHPPDGTSACLAKDKAAWIGSLSGSDWGPIPNADEVLLRAGCDDATYLAALDGLLGRRPAEAALAFVVAGGDVLKNDRLGVLGLSLQGVMERDARVLAALGRIPSVWLPAGGYHPDSWRAFAGTAQLLATGRRDLVPAEPNPLRGQFAGIAEVLDAHRLGEDEWITAADIDAALGGWQGEKRFLGHYTSSGMEYGLYRYGVLTQLQRLGYTALRVATDHEELGDRMRIYGSAGGLEHLLVEVVLARDRVQGEPVLFVHWLTLRHPRALFSAARPRLRGQEVPGLGMAREAGEMLGRIATRLGLKGVAFRPMHLHSAWTARHDFTFVDPARQGRFEALMRDAGGRSLTEIDRAIDEGRVMRHGAPYAWESDLMVYWNPPRPLDRGAVERARDAEHFTFVEARPAVAPVSTPAASPQRVA